MYLLCPKVVQKFSSGFFLLLFLFLLLRVPVNTDAGTIVETQMETVGMMPQKTHSVEKHQIYPQVAIVMPVFTAAAYLRYYSYYRCFNDLSCTPEEAPNYFRRSPSNSWSTSTGADGFINRMMKLGYPSDRISIITDLDVHNNNLYHLNGTPIYSSVMFVHNEYVTMNEYQNTIQFIKNGGNVIILNGNAFFGEVDYDPVRNDVIMVDAHGFSFDGVRAAKSTSYHRFNQGIANFEHHEWFGSRYCAFRKGSTDGAKFIESKNTHPVAISMISKNIPVMAPNYDSHEENCLITPNFHEIASWQTSFAQGNRGIKIYEFFPHGPIGGSLIHFGFFGTDVLESSSTSVKSVIEVIRHQSNQLKIPWIRYPSDGSFHQNGVTIDYTNYYPHRIYLNGSLMPNLQRFDYLHLNEGNYNLSIVFSYLGEEFVKEVSFTIDNTPPTIVPTIEHFPDGSLKSLQFLAIDESPDLISSYIYESQPNSRLPVKLGNGSKELILDVKENYVGIANNGSFGIRIDAIDSAGNSAMEFYNYNNSGVPSNPISRSHLFRGDFIQMNSTYGYIELGKVDPSLEARIRLSYDFGQSWLEIPAVEENNLTVAYIEKESEHFWYNVAYYDQSDTYVSSYRDTRSFYWNQQITYLNSISRIENTTHSMVTTKFNTPEDPTKQVELTIENDAGQILANYVGELKNGTIKLEFELFEGNLVVKYKDPLRNTLSVQNLYSDEVSDLGSKQSNNLTTTQPIEIGKGITHLIDEVLYFVDGQAYNDTYSNSDFLMIAGSNVKITILFLFRDKNVSVHEIIFRDELLPSFTRFHNPIFILNEEGAHIRSIIYSNTKWNISLLSDISLIEYQGNYNEQLFLKLSYLSPVDFQIKLILSWVNGTEELNQTLSYIVPASIILERDQTSSQTPKYQPKQNSNSTNNENTSDSTNSETITENTEFTSVSETSFNYIHLFFIIFCIPRFSRKFYTKRNAP